MNVFDMLNLGHVVNGGNVQCCANPASNYMFKLNRRNTRKRYEICWKLTIKTHQ